MPDPSPADVSPVHPGSPAETAIAGDLATGETRRERIYLETERHRIEGDLTLARDGYRSRVSDVLNAAERDFLMLTDVELRWIESATVERHPFLAVARRHIVFVATPGEVGRQ